jgi:hypothetical protein
MPETTATTLGEATQYTKLVWRRLEEPLRVLNTDLPWQVWLVALGLVLAVAFFYVAWMYVKDSRGVGPWWATLLGLLRSAVYVLLALVFLLPSKQTFIETRTEGKVLLIPDISASMQTSDEPPTGRSGERLVTRQDKVLEFLQHKDWKFIRDLEKKNPVTAYRFGTILDEKYLHFADGRVWTRQERETPKHDDFGAVKLPEQKMLPEDYWKVWLNPSLKLDAPGGWSKEEQERLDDLTHTNAALVADGVMRGTNIGDSLLGALNRELSNRVQGIVVFTDGRQTEGSVKGLQELQRRAKAARVPIFVVAVGEDRPKVKIEIVDLRLPPQVQPEDKFRAVLELTGEGLAGQAVDVSLDVTNTRRVRGKDGKEKEEALPIKLIEAEDKDNPKAPRVSIDLGTKLTLKPAAEVRFDKSNPPRAEVEFPLDAAALAAAAGKNLAEGEYKGKKWELDETVNSELKFQARVPADKREGLRVKEHLSNKVEVRVLKRPMRVLLVASGANRDYQFVRTLLVREMEKKRMDLSIHLQLPPGIMSYPGDKERRVQDVPPEKMLTAFPDTFDAKPGNKYDLTSYDVVIAFDPDWTRFTPDQVKALAKWAHKGGGLVLVGGYINTVELVRPHEGEEEGKYKEILDLLPVVLADGREYMERNTDDPWPLDFSGATNEMEFLKLEEDDATDAPFSDWKAFFFGTGKEATPDKAQRGFYNFYPVERAKTGSLVAARFLDPKTKLKDGTFHPYMVLNPDTRPRVVWVGSAETWRLREYREGWHERFWTKLVRYVGSKSQGTVRRRIRVEMNKQQIANRPISVEAKIDGPSGDPLDRSAKPEITLKLPAGANPKDVKMPVLMTPRAGNRDGWFTGQFVVKAPGEYELRLRVKEIDEVETTKFVVKEANPELDNTRPDFARMYRLASEADEVMLRMADADRQELKRRLQPPRVTREEGEGRDKDEPRTDKLRLYFDLHNAELIPSCMQSAVEKQTSRGPVHDLWDEGVTVYTYPQEEGKPPRQPVKISYVLIACVGLLSMEWLIRKLLRLA